MRRLRPHAKFAVASFLKAAAKRLVCVPLAVPVALLACAAPAGSGEAVLVARPPAGPAAAAPADAAAAAPVVLHVLGTSDVHGHVEALPILGGYLAILRQKAGADHVLMVDAGDMFQGTLESNLGEGAAVVRAYNALRYDAVAIGNHEFDFGPAGAKATPEAGDDPRGALKARASEAKYPFLTANVEDVQTGKPFDAPNILPSTIVEKAGVKVGLVGVTSEDTPRTTIALNFAGLRAASITGAVVREATALRTRGADVVVLLAHAGGKCKNVEDASDASSCLPNEEIMKVLAALPKGTLDAVVAGHTHQGMAQFIGGVPVVQSYSYGRAFGRIDLTIDPASRRVTAAKVFPPTELRTHATFEGEDVRRDEGVAAAFADDVAKAKTLKETPLGVILDTRLPRHHDEESPVGNLLVDLMRADSPTADVALANGGGLRADLPEGPLTYGALFELMPFDNKFAKVTLSGAELRKLFERNLTTEGGIFSVSGIRVKAHCAGRSLKVDLVRENGKAIADGDSLTLVTSDFLALGGDGTSFSKEHVTLESTLLREALERQLRKRGGHLRASDVFDPAHRRLDYPGSKPVRCE